MKLKSRLSIKFTVAKRNSRWQGKLTCINPETFKLKELSFSNGLSLWQIIFRELE